MQPVQPVYTTFSCWVGEVGGKPREEEAEGEQAEEVGQQHVSLVDVPDKENNIVKEILYTIFIVHVVPFHLYQPTSDRNVKIMCFGIIKFDTLQLQFTQKCNII